MSRSSTPLFCLLLALLCVASISARAEKIIFEDHFKGVETLMPDGTKKQYPDRTKWAFTFLPGIKWPDSYGDGTNWLAGNNECQTYLNPFLKSVKQTPVPVNLRYDPFSIKQDGLHITADVLTPAQQKIYQVGGYRRFGSGILISRPSFAYGKIRVVAKLPNARGSWPAIWLLPAKFSWPPEIDILEGMAWGPHTHEVHSGLIGLKNENASYNDWFDVGTDLSKGFHEYGLDWTKDTLKATFDGKVLWEKPTPPSMKQPMYILINLAVGGQWPYNELKIMPIDGTSAERLTAGSDLIEDDYPAEMIVKSVTVSQ